MFNPVYFKMMEKQSSKQLLFYLALIKRGRYMLVVPLVVATITGGLIAFNLPPVYRSVARIFYFQPQIPENMLVRSVNMYLEAAVVFIDSVTFSRENCLRIIKDLNLYPGNAAILSEDELVQYMKNHYRQIPVYTEIADKNNRPQEVITGFKLSFEHKRPEAAFETVKMLSDDFIANYRNFRQNFAVQTSSFFEEEKQRLRLEISIMDQKMSDFKKNNLMCLPDLFQSNYRMLENLRQRLTGLNQERKLLEEKKINLESAIYAVNPRVAMKGLSGSQIISPEEKLCALKLELKLLMATCSNQHPDVISTKSAIKAMAGIIPLQGVNPGGKPVGDIFNPSYISLRAGLESINLEIIAIERRIVVVKKDMLNYRLRLERSPLVEKEYNALVRDLDSVRRRYNELANQLLKLESSAAMEERQIAGRLSLSQIPTFPLKPVKPNRMLIITGFFLAGACIGVLLLMAWDFAGHNGSEVVACSESVLLVNKKPSLPAFSCRSFLVILFVLLFLMIAAQYFHAVPEIVFVRLLNVIKGKILLSGLEL